MMGTTNVSSGLSSSRPWTSRRTGSLTLRGLRHVEVVQFAFDLVALMAAWQITFELRLLINPWMSLSLTASQLHKAAPSLAGLLTLWVATNLWLIISGRRNGGTGSSNVFRLSEAILSVSLVGIVAALFSEEIGAGVSRSFMLLFAPVSYCTLIAARVAQNWIWIRMAQAWPGIAERVAIVGAGQGVRAAATRLRMENPSDVSLVGIIVPSGASEDTPADTTPILGETATLAELINRNRLNRLVVLSGSFTAEQSEACYAVARRMGVVLSHELAGLPGLHVSVQTRFGMQMLECQPISFTRTEELWRRFLDLAGATVLILCLFPLLLVAAVLVKLSSKGPVLYRAPRVGRGGRHFTFYKFRTMTDDPQGRRSVAAANERSGHLFKVKRDPRITPIGRVLRRFSIDETPQLFNVLLGDMSLLGPRPLPAEDLDPDGMSRQYPAWAELRALVKPGLTGLWQVRGRSDLSFEQMIRLDLEYVQNWSLLLDLKILLATPLVVITGRGAY